MNKPNILYINSHDTGRYVEPYGYPVSTPNLRSLARDGVLFRQAFCASPTCSPSRASLVTGLCAHSSGMLGLAHRGFHLNDYRQHIVHTLRQDGYFCAIAGIQHVDGHGSNPSTYGARIGYDRILDIEDWKSGRGARMADERAAEFLAGRPPQPFYLEVGFSETHRDFPAPEPEDDARFCQPLPGLPDTLVARQDAAAFRTSARHLDRRMGRVLDALARAGLADNTLVIATTDHGPPFPRMKCNLTDGGLGVFLIMRGPNGFTGGKVVDGLVSQVDLFPTLCEVLGIRPPAWLQGVSLMPLVRDPRINVREEISAEVNYHAAYEPMRCVRTARWKYIRRYHGWPKPVLPNCDDSPSKTLWVEQGWADAPVAEQELYDLALDPFEARNLAPDPRCAGALAEIRERLEAWMRNTDDPLLRGPIPAPSGARVNRQDQKSPRDAPDIVP